jgi:hypothetical protein
LRKFIVLPVNGLLTIYFIAFHYVTLLIISALQISCFWMKIVG